MGSGELETARQEARDALAKERALREVLEQAIDKALVSHRGDLGKDFGDLAAKKNEFDGSYMGKQQGLAERVATDLGDLLAAAKEERDGRLALEKERDAFEQQTDKLKKKVTALEMERDALLKNLADSKVEIQQVFDCLSLPSQCYIEHFKTYHSSGLPPFSSTQLNCA